MRTKARKSQRRVRQYTLRGVPEDVDAVLRRMARTQGRSLNEVALEILRRGIGLANGGQVHHDLDHLIGSMGPDPELDAIFEEMRRIDPEMWR